MNTNSHYDLSSQRRTILSFGFWAFPSLAKNVLFVPCLLALTSARTMQFAFTTLALAFRLFKLRRVVRKCFWLQPSTLNSHDPANAICRYEKAIEIMTHIVSSRRSNSDPCNSLIVLLQAALDADTVPSFPSTWRKPQSRRTNLLNHKTCGNRAVSCSLSHA